jgi:hypothetical protein
MKSEGLTTLCPTRRCPGALRFGRDRRSDLHHEGAARPYPERNRRAEISQRAAAVSEAKAVPAEEEVETIVTKDAAPAFDPAGAGEKSTAEQEPEHTGSIQSASSGPAIVLNPGIEVTEEPAPSEAAPAEPSDPSDD